MRSEPQIETVKHCSKLVECVFQIG